MLVGSFMYQNLIYQGLFTHLVVVVVVAAAAAAAVVVVVFVT